MLGALCAQLASAQTDVVTVAARIAADEQSQALSSTTIQGYRDSLSSTGTWADVDYKDKSITGWSPATHTARLESMAQAYRKPTHTLYGDASLSNAIHRALKWWTTNDFTSSNWWYNEIDTPRKLGRVLLLLGGEASSNEITASLTMLNRAQNYMSWTGQNRMWEAGNTLVKGLILSNAGICVTSSAAINGLLITQTSEGVLPDYSFQQHGPQLYTGGYGSAFAADAPYWLDMLRNTSWAATTGQINVVAQYLLEGVRWEIWEKQWAFDVTGRGISRGVPGATSMVTPFYRMTNIVPAQASQFAAFAGALNGGGVFGSTMRGNKHYWWSDQSVHRATNWSVTVRMCSTRIQGTECGNNEGLKDYYLGDCTTFFLGDGNEYRSIQPMWDWRKIPGVTCPQKTGALPVLGWSGYMGSNSFVGGVSDGTNGAAIMNLARDGLSVRKASFMFDDAAVFLGAGLSYTVDTTRITTTINQSLLNTAAAFARIGATQIVSSGSFVITNALWVQQDGFGYLRLDTNDAWTMTALAQTGSWYDLNYAYSTQQLATNVLTLFIDHGTKPANDLYAYAVVPAATSTIMNALAASPPVSVLTNSPSLQAAYHFASHQMQAIFQQAGGVTVPDGTRIEADASCAMTARLLPGGVTIFASRPDHSTATLTVRVSRVLSGSGANWIPAKQMTQVVIPMPTGNNAGASTSVVLSGIGFSVPGVSSAYGANAWLTDAMLYGALTNGGAADVTVVWDTSDRGTNLTSWITASFLPMTTQGVFSVAVTNLSSGSSYVYRCFASNSYGIAWSDPRPFRTASATRPSAISGLALWLDAGDIKGNGSATADGAAITNWVDKSGNGRNALAGTGTSSWPHVRSASFNGKPALYFAGTNYLDAGATTVYNNTNGMTIFVICRTPSASNIAVISKDCWNANQREWAIHSGDFQCQKQTNSMNVSNRVDFLAITNTQQMIGRWQPGIRTEIIRDGDSLGAALSPASSMTPTTCRLLVGSVNSNDSTRYLTGDIAEVAIYSRALATNEMHLVGASLAAKYALPYSYDTRNADADGDGIADDFERANYGGVNVLGPGDTDRDGMPDWQEVVAGTDPLRATSLLEVNSAVLATNGQFLVRWQSATGRVYNVQRADSPAAIFTNVFTNVAATPMLNSWTTQPASAAGVYRVIVGP